MTALEQALLTLKNDAYAVQRDTIDIRDAATASVVKDLARLVERLAGLMLEAEGRKRV